MGKTLVISDVHANPWALDAVFKHAVPKFKPDEIWFLGDLLGYGPDPYSVWKKLCGNPMLPTLYLAGNHDWGVVGLIEGPKVINEDNGVGLSGVRISHYRDIAFHVISVHQKHLASKKDLMAKLASLPVMSSPRPGVYLAHGEFGEHLDHIIKHYTVHPYNTPDQLAARFVSARSMFPQYVDLPTEYVGAPPLIFATGHTHVQGLWRWDAVNCAWQPRSIEQPYIMDDLQASPIMFNPGSVGFPRDLTGCPAYAVIDWDACLMYFERVWYDTTQLRKQMSSGPYVELIEDPQFFIEPHCQEST